jgi:hypothetical protein
MLHAQTQLPPAQGATQLPPAQGAAPAGAGATAAPAAPAGGPSQAEIQDMQNIQKMQVQSVADADARLKALDAFVAKYPTSPFKSDVLTMAGETASMTGNSAKASFYYEEAIKADPKADYAMIMLGAEIARNTKENDINKKEKLDRAEKLAKEGMDLAAKREKLPNQPEDQYKSMQKDDIARGHMTLGFVAMANQKDVEAGKEFMQSVDLAANGDAMNLLRAGMAFNNGKDFTSANAALDRFLAIPNIPDQYKKMAEDEKKRGQALRNQK